MFLFSAEKAIEPIKSPLVKAAVQAADLDFRRDGTPERVEFENSVADETAKEVPMRRMIITEK